MIASAGISLDESLVDVDLPDRLAKAGYDNGLIFRGFGDGILGLAPALATAPAEFELPFGRLNCTPDQVLDQPEAGHALA